MMTMNIRHRTEARKTTAHTTHQILENLSFCVQFFFPSFCFPKLSSHTHIHASLTEVFVDERLFLIILGLLSFFLDDLARNLSQCQF